MRITNLMYLLLVVTLYSCHDDTKPFYKYPLSQDPTFRLGKWYSVTDSGTVGTNHNTNLDTIWFVSDSLAGWTGFVPHQPKAYTYMTTYFSDPVHIVYIIRNYSDTTRFDTVTHECGLTLTGDTMGIYWDVSTRPPWVEKYVKKKN